MNPSLLVDRAARFGRAAATAARANVARLPAPMKLTFAVTYWCQYRCATCNIWQRKPEDELSTDEIRAFIDRNPGFVWADVTGGEIFLRADAAEMLERMASAWKRLAILHFPTNGFLTDRIVAAARALAARGRGPAIVITVSVDGDRDLNDAIRGIKGGFDRQMATLRSLREIPGIRVVAGMTLSAANVEHVDRTMRACQRACPGLAPDDFHVNVMQLSSHYYGNDALQAQVPRREDLVRVIDRLGRQRALPTTPAAWLEGRYLGNLGRFLDTGKSPMRCHALRSSCFVDPWGVVYPCLTYSKPVGRLREHGMALDRIWADASTRERQREIWAGHCPQCWTACDAYPSILGNALIPGRRLPVDGRA